MFTSYKVSGGTLMNPHCRIVRCCLGGSTLYGHVVVERRRKLGTLSYMEIYSLRYIVVDVG